MSEYWVSKNKYFCKYCNIYIADDAPSRKQHETGLRHKGNVERFVRGLYKAGEKRKTDLEEEKREMARIEKAAGAAYAQDVASGLTKPGSSSTAGPSSSAAAVGPKVAPPKPSNPYANYTTAESLGYTDPDLERAKAEAERRRTEGVAGEWQVVDVIPAPPEEGEEGERPKQEGEDLKPGEISARAGEKRPAQEPVDEEDARGWKLRRKTAGVGLGDLYDPGALPIKLKPKKQEDQGAAAGATVTLASGGSEKPQWSARGWNKPGALSAAGATERANGEEVKAEENGIKAGEDGVAGKLMEDLLLEEPPIEVKTEEVKTEPVQAAAPPPPAGGSLFKKRKAPVGGGSRGGRRFEG